MPRDPTPIVFSFDLFSFWAAASPKETPKKNLGENFIFVWVRQSPCKKTRAIMGPWPSLKKNTVTKQKIPASFRRMRCVTLL